MEYPININVKSIKVDDSTFLYDGDTGFLTESTGILDDVVKLISYFTKEQIVEKLEEKYNKEAIINCLKQLDDLYDKKLLFDREKKAVARTPEVYKKDWEDGKLLVNLWLNVSHDCNIRCIYCFGHGGSYGGSRALMSVETAKKSIDYWFKYLNKNIPITTVTFFGGEPLMNMEVIKFSINYINKLLKDYDIQVQYIITTNGTIFNDDIIKLFVENDIRFTISIDGGQAIQDRNRPYASGKGSFEVVKKNVAKLRRYYDKLSARMTLTHEDVPYLKQAVMDLWDIGFTDVVYEFVTIADENLSIMKQDVECLRKQIQELNQITYENIVNKKRQFFTNTIKYAGFIHSNKVKNECSFQSPYTIMFTPSGEMFKCHRMMDDHKHCVGNLTDGIDWELFSQNTRKYIEETECKDCWAKRICGGGCAQENCIYTGDVSKHYDLLCDEIKMLAEESLKFYAKMYLENEKDFHRIFI